MKLNILKNSVYLATMVLCFASCADSDKVVDSITDEVTRGAILRQVNVISNSVAINSATNVLESDGEFAVDLEYQDDEDGDLLASMNVYLGYADNTDDGVDNSVAEILHETIPASDFTTGDRGLPVLTYRISSAQMQSALGLSDDQFGLEGDDFIVRFEIVLTDGRSFTDAQNSGTITGSFFASPFRNTVRIVCAPSVPTAGTWNVLTVDSWGDGWNGGLLNIVIDGTAIAPIENVDGGIPGPVETIQEYTFEVPAGSETISMIYSSGAFDEEVSFVVTSANGNEVVNAGPTPPVGAELLDYCPDNL